MPKKSDPTRTRISVERRSSRQIRGRLLHVITASKVNQPQMDGEKKTGSGNEPQDMDQDQVNHGSSVGVDVESAALALLANNINKIMRCIGPMVNKLEDLDKRVELMETGLKEYLEKQAKLHPTREKPPPYNPDIRFPTFPEKFDCDVFRKWVKEVELYFEYYRVPGYQQFELVVASLPQEGEVFQWWQDINELCTKTRLHLLKPIGWKEMKRLVMHKFLRPMLV
ncbi:unnamed protein product [Lactuca saligna]|uniref:Retrotransposon gag domain-containing protein n=1 Tax=Lactuca saligna TaxID=75948 RepID=A0AA35ZZR1_LACSI|nr:unnamed protein product [Lactuca saligna]